MKYIAHIGIVAYTVALAQLAAGIVGLVNFSELPHRGGCRDNRVENCLVAAKDDGGYVPPNHDGPDSRNGTGTRYK
ncbi:MAG: hypothetical protein V7L22_23355 [Nostoc sp.]|uniref:hypothetical protein n=1 Tax=Nostoc sp. TaxID=1180 RepID=UPI002FF54864